jgi:hypothetical protein
MDSFFRRNDFFKKTETLNKKNEKGSEGERGHGRKLDKSEINVKNKNHTA